MPAHQCDSALRGSGDWFTQSDCLETSPLWKWVRSMALAHRRVIILYVALLLVATSLAILSGKAVLAAASQAFPGLVALALMLLLPGRRERLSQLGLERLGRPGWYLVALVPAVPIALSYLGAWAMGWVDLPPAEAMQGLSQWERIRLLTRSYLAWWLPLPFLWSLGEELGWRGFLYAEATSIWPLPKAAFFTGVVWSAWHYGFIFGADYYTEGNPWINTGLFSVTVVLMSVVLAWLRAASGSLWPAVVFHGLSNLAWGYWNVVFPVKQEGWVYVAGEAGVLNVLFWSLAAWYAWRRLDAFPSGMPGRAEPARHTG